MPAQLMITFYVLYVMIRMYVNRLSSYEQGKLCISRGLGKHSESCRIDWMRRTSMRLIRDLTATRWKNQDNDYFSIIMNEGNGSPLPLFICRANYEFQWSKRCCRIHDLWNHSCGSIHCDYLSSSFFFFFLMLMTTQITASAINTTVVTNSIVSYILSLPSLF